MSGWYGERGLIMRNDIIDVFNQLTDSQLADCELFKNLILLHYEKFKFFYSIIECVCLKTIQSITCLEKPQVLKIFIKFNNEKEIKNFVKIFNDSNKRKLCKYFSLKIEKNGSYLNISIENNGISREEEIYEDRFN